MRPLSPIRVGKDNLYGMQVSVGESLQKNSKVYLFYAEIKTSIDDWIDTIQAATGYDPARITRR